MPTFQAGHYELQSTSILANHTGDRPSFVADISRGLFNSGHFQVFALPQGLLFLELRLRDYGNLGPSSPGGGLGGAMAAYREGDRYGFAPEDKWETGFDAHSEEQLFELAAERKKSFVSKLDEIQSVSIDAPGFLGRTFGDSSVAGWITIRDKSLGKVSLEVKEAAALSVAVDALPRRLGSRVRVNVAFDQNSRRFVPR
jgi:hypothetical protein